MSNSKQKNNHSNVALVICSLGCGNNISNDKMDNHIKNKCVKRLVICPLGCENNIAYDKMDNHVKNECVKFILSLDKVNHSLALHVANTVVYLLKKIMSMFCHMKKKNIKKKLNHLR